MAGLVEVSDALARCVRRRDAFRQRLDMIHDWLIRNEGESDPEWEELRSFLEGLDAI